jgi:hypothetical protein
MTDDTIDSAPEVTEGRIRDLLARSVADGDGFEQALCLIALGELNGHEGCIDALLDSEWADIDPIGDRGIAWAECARLIAGVE